MAHRFFADKPILSDQVLLGETEARHLSQVMRKQTGEQVVVFDGSGCEFIATITKVDRKCAELSVDERVEADRELPFELIVAAALPKGDRQTWMVQKLVELGVTRLIPVTTNRGVAQPTGKAIERLKRHVIEASKQCERNVLMDISLAVDVASLTNALPTDCMRFVAHVDSDAPSRFVPTPVNVCFAVGPEGGFTDDEVHLLTGAGWNSIRLGDRILRIETAAVALAAWWGITNCVAE